MQNQTPPITHDIKSARKSFSRIGWALLLYLAVSYALTYAIYYGVLKFAPYLIVKDWFMWVYSVAPMYIIGVPVFLIFASKAPRHKLESKKLSGKNFFIFVAISFAVMYFGNLISSYLMAIIQSYTGVETTNPVSEMLSGSSIWLNAIVVAVLAPIVEEVLFRKVIIDRTHVWGEKTAVVFSALLFGIFHGNFYQFFYAFGIGLLFGYIYVRTGRIRYTIILHMMINGLSGVFASWLIGKLPEELLNKLLDFEYLSSLGTEELLELIMPHAAVFALYALYAFGLIALAIIGTALLLAYRKRFFFKKTPTTLPREYIGAAVYSTPGVVAIIAVCLILMAISLFS